MTPTPLLAAPFRPLWPLFLISAASVGYEIALTRYFAVAKWSEYGYWVISIVMAGFALSGVVVALARERLMRRVDLFLAWLPPALVLAAAAGFWATTVNPFNPLQLQNAVTFGTQLFDIFLYYAALLPFFFGAGLYISLSFVANGGRVPIVYGYDLIGAGTGAALVLGLMFVLHPFQLVPALLLPLAASALFGRRLAPVLAALLALGAAETALRFAPAPDYNDYKSIYAPLHTPDARIVAEVRSPRGLYALLDDFTERVDTDLSNNTGLLDLPGPPPAFGLYRDGSRVAALPKPGETTAAYAPGELSALPYTLLARPAVLLVGASGGFAARHALALGAADVTVLEPDPVLRRAAQRGLGPSLAPAAAPNVHQSTMSPLSPAGRFDLIELSGDFLDSGEANAAAYAQEAILADLRALRPGGLLSLPVSIREFPVYAVRVLATVRQALHSLGQGDPAQRVLVYRSAWNVRILVSPDPLTPERIEAARKFCDDRSFDVSYFPGIDPATAQANIYNDLPPVDFEHGNVETGAGPQDAVGDEAGPTLAGDTATESQRAFDLRPVTLDRPFYYSILRLDRLPQILSRLEILPQAEVGQLVNLAVLAQAAILAALVLLLPLAAPRVAGAGAGRVSAPRAVVTFACLGLGFLFIEIYLIEKASLYLSDRTSGFALVLTGMLVFSGFGSLVAERVPGGVATAIAVIGAACALALLELEPFLIATIAWPPFAKAATLLALIAPVSVALGMPFPLALARAGAGGGALLPWAWALNGAFSVVATPAANLLAVEGGFSRVLLAGLLLYGVVLISFPSVRKSIQWQPSPTH